MATVILRRRHRCKSPMGDRTSRSFRRWAESEDFPEEGRVCFINGEVWADMSQAADFFTSARSRTRSNAPSTGLATEGWHREVLAGRVTDLQRGGRPLGGAGRLVHLVRRTTAPAASSLSKAGMVDSPPWTVRRTWSSRSSATVRRTKTTNGRCAAYLDAGVKNIGLIDARSRRRLRFDVYKAGAKVSSRCGKIAGWVKSAVFEQIASASR